MSRQEKSVLLKEQNSNNLNNFERTKGNLPCQINKKDDERTKMGAIEHQALAMRVLNIMNIAIERLQVALVIPFLLTNEEVINRFISRNHKNRLFKHCEKYLEHIPLASSCENEKNILTDPNLVKAIDLLHQNKELQNCMPEYVEILPDISKKLFNSIKDLKILAEIRMNTSASMEMEREKMLHQIWHENKKMQEKIEQLKSHLHEKEVTMQWRITEKQALIKKYKADLANKKWNNNVLIQREVAAAHERLQQICTKSEDRQQRLREEAQKAQRGYEKLLKDNILADKKFREKKARVLTQLKGWIKKYDNDIGERTREIEQLNAELNEKTCEFDVFMKEYEKQEAEYNAVMLMREEEERKMQHEKMLLFMMNRAAKIIQLAWRRYYQKKKKKGKGKAKKGKK